jgi:hypothetical protein
MALPADPVELRGLIKTDEKRMEFDSGMVRSPSADRIDFTLIRSGPMLERWAIHLTAGALHYGKNNWLQAAGQAELDRFRESAARHFEQWLADMTDEDHAAAVFFNINGAEYVRDRNRNRA